MAEYFRESIGLPLHFGLITGKFVQRLCEVEDIMDVRKISAEDTLALRHRVLWPDKSVDFCRLEEDEASLHFGAFVAGSLFVSLLYLLPMMWLD